MKKLYLTSIVFIAFLLVPVSYVFITSDQQQELNSFQLTKLKVHFSKDDSLRAAYIGHRTQRAMELYDTLFKFSPNLELLVLNSEDWKINTQMPVYGMPHYSNGRLIVASRENSFWSDFLPTLEKLPDNQAHLIRQTYEDEKGNLSMKKFFDLVAIHELGHGYHIQANVNMQRKWLQEFFANLLMYSYVAEKEPELLPIIDVFSEMVVNQGTAGFQYVTLLDFEKHYSDIANKSPQNYGWYQSKLNLIAKEIYEQSGIEPIEILWLNLKDEKRNLNDEQLNYLLINTLGQSLANDLINW